MTDERDSRDHDAAPAAAPASDLPTPAEDRSATTDLATDGDERPREGESVEAETSSKGEAQAAGEATETGQEEEVGAASTEGDGRLLDEGRERAAPAAQPAAGAEEPAASEPRSEEAARDEGEEKGAVETVAEEPAASDPSEQAAGAAFDEQTAGAPSAGEPPTGDTASPSEDVPGTPDDAGAAEATAPEPPDVSAETSSEAAEVAAAEAPTEREAEPADDSSAPSPESVSSTTSERVAGAPAAAEESAAEQPTTAAGAEQPAAMADDEPAAEERPATEQAPSAEDASPPSPESVSPAATGTAAEARAAEEPAAEQETPAPAAEQPAPEAGKPPAPEPEAPEDPALAELRRAKEEGTTVEGKVIGWNRGGFHVVVGEITAFCPSSEMELGRPRSPQSYVDHMLQFRVVKFQKKGRRVVLSRATVLGEERQRVVGKLAPGAVVSGRVTSLPDFGAFVDLGGVEGLVHVSEISRGRVKSPKEALQVGQEVEVKVLKVEQEGERISLSMKDLEPDPWQGVAERYSRGEKFPGKIARRADFGLFVELEPEVEGLVHVSQLPPGTELGDPSLDPGREIEVWVREVDRKRQRISLSLREVPTEDPWKGAAKRFPEGEMVEGTVESIAPFGVFVHLAPGLTGLLPGSQTGLPKGTSAARAFTPGQKVRVQVLSIDPRRKRISLGREGSRVEATRGDLQEFKKQQREREQDAPTAMAAAFARLRDGSEESGKS